MKRSVWLYAALLALALVAGLSAPSTAPESPVPSADNPGAHGLKLLRAWLTQTGRDVRLLRDFELPPELKTLVIAAPSGHAVSADERARLEAFVKAGGTLVYLRPRRSRLQRELDDWLELAPGPSPAEDLQGRDVLGVSQPVQFLRGVKTVRVLADETVVSSLPQAVPLAGSLLWAPLGRGGVFIGAGADLAEGARLELDDNAAFWAGLPAPLAFDELHQAPLPRPNLSANLVAVLLQLSFCALCLLLTFGRRLGPPRPTLTEQHRSSLEYVRSMAALNRQARVEPELAHELCARLARLLEVPVGDLPVNADEVRTPEEFLALAQRCADLEAPNRSLSSRT